MTNNEIIMLILLCFTTPLAVGIGFALGAYIYNDNSFRRRR
jgi:hypothetical protein